MTTVNTRKKKNSTMSEQERNNEPYFTNTIFLNALVIVEGIVL